MTFSEYVSTYGCPSVDQNLRRKKQDSLKENWFAVLAPRFPEIIERTTSLAIFLLGTVTASLTDRPEVMQAAVVIAVERSGCVFATPCLSVHLVTVNCTFLLGIKSNL